MAIAIDFLSSGSDATNDDEFSWTHGTSITPSFITVGVGSRNGTAAITVTYGGVELTKAVELNDGTFHASIWYGPNALAGSQTISVTMDGASTSKGAGAISYTGGGALGATGSNGATSDATLIEIASSGSSIVVDHHSSGGGWTVGADQTERYSIGGRLKGSTEAGAASVDMTWSRSGSFAFVHCAISVDVAAAAPPALPDFGIGGGATAPFQQFNTPYSFTKGSIELDKTFKNVKLF